MRMKTIKMDYYIWEKLKNINTDMDEALRTLLGTLRNEAEEMYATQMIEYNNEIIKKNEDLLKSIPLEREKEKMMLQHKLKLQKNQCELALRSIAIKLKGLHVVNPTYGYESDPDWIALLLDDLNAAEDVQRKRLQETVDALSKVDEVFDNENKWTEQEKLYTQQIDRAKREIERMKGMLKLAERLNLLPEGIDERKSQDS